MIPTMMTTFEKGVQQGLRLVFADQGPRIADLELALKDGWTSGNGLGLGLSGARRLVNEFDIQTAPGQGTTIRMTLPVSTDEGLTN